MTLTRLARFLKALIKHMFRPCCSEGTATPWLERELRSCSWDYALTSSSYSLINSINMAIIQIQEFHLTPQRRENLSKKKHSTITLIKKKNHLSLSLRTRTTNFTTESRELRSEKPAMWFSLNRRYYTNTATVDIVITARHW